MSSSNSSYATTLAHIIANITLYIDTNTLIFGVIGGICNLITLTDRQMRQSSTVFYLLCATVSQLITILFCVPLRLYANLATNYLENRSVIFCKIRYYLIVTLPALSPYYMCLASLDRCLSTSIDARIRLWNQLKVEKYLSAGTMIIIFVISTHILIFYDIYNNKCQISPGNIYGFIFAGYLIVVITFLPHLFMFIFCVITLWNIRKSRQRLVPALTKNPIPNRRRTQRLELKLIKIIVIQVLLSASLTLLRLGSYSYMIIAGALMQLTVDEYAAGAFATSLGGCLYFFNFGISFYVSILSSKFFRTVFYERITFIYRHYIRQLIQRNLQQ